MLRFWLCASKDKLLKQTNKGKCPKIVNTAIIHQLELPCNGDLLTKVRFYNCAKNRVSS